MKLRMPYTVFSVRNLFVLSLVILTVSCASPEKARYFNKLGDETFPRQELVSAHVIRKADILSINVSSINIEENQIFNAPNVAVVPGLVNENPTHGAGYLVDNDGMISFPMIGNVKVEGLNKKQVSELIRDKLISAKLMLDPIIAVRILNFRVTVLGEVASPKIINVPNEKITLMEALGMAGDMTLYAKRDNVLLIREEGDEKITRRLNLNNKELLESPYYYLRANDVIYVESNSVKLQNTSRLNQLLPTVLSGLAFLAIIIDRYR